MKAGPTVLRFDWSKAGLRIFPYEYEFKNKLSFKTGKMLRTAFYVVTDLSTSNDPEEPYRALVLSRLESVKVY